MKDEELDGVITKMVIRGVKKFQWQFTVLIAGEKTLVKESYVKICPTCEIETFTTCSNLSRKEIVKCYKVKEFVINKRNFLLEHGLWFLFVDFPFYFMELS